MNPTLTPEARAAYWQQHINHCQAAALSGVQYCQQHQLTYHCFLYWRRKLSRPVAVQNSDPKLRSQEATSAFINVRPQSSVLPSVMPEASSIDPLQLALPNGLVICNIQAANLNTVRALLETL